jgi:glutamine amidotransferase
MSAKLPVAIVDYGAGNLLSVSRALVNVGADVTLAKNAQAVRDAGHIILPGVGAFGRGMEELGQRELVEPLLNHAESGKPFLGICLGMQMMLDTSDEFGHHSGLGLIPGRVKIIPKTTINEAPHKIPHIGWNNLLPTKNNNWQNTLLDGLPSGISMYFVHSFTAYPRNADHRLADADYNGRTVSAVIQRENLTGFQCHPEKSGEIGLRVLKNFVSLN